MLTTSILIVEDDLELSSLLRSYLLDKGMDVAVANSGASAEKSVSQKVYDVVLLDLTLPDISGVEVCKHIKKNSPDTVVIMLTGKTEINDKKTGFQSGADDYITKPFEIEEVFLRILARTQKQSSTVLKYGKLSINQNSMSVSYDGKTVDLTPYEYKLLVFLAQRPNMVTTRENILDKVWGYESQVETRVVDVYIGYLRQKIDSEFNTSFIQSKRGFGYMFVTDDRRH